MHSFLDPALQPLWRDEASLQLGLEPDRAVVVTGIDPARRRLLAGQDGQPGARSVLRGELLRLGIPVADEPRTGRLAARLAPEVASAVLATGSRPTAERVVAARAQRVVGVYGCGRVGAQVALLLGAAGIGTLLLEDPEPAGPGDEVPGVDVAGGTGRRRDLLVEEALLRELAPAPPALESQRPMDLLVIAPAKSLGRRRSSQAMRDAVVHLPVLLLGRTASIGPLVLPGRTPCLGCLDAHRVDRDPAWAALAVQADARGPDDPPIDVTLAALAAAQVAQQVIGFLDGHEVATVGATLETSLPGGRTRRRCWPLHPGCGCRWDAQLELYG